MKIFIEKKDDKNEAVNYITFSSSQRQSFRINFWLRN